MDFKGLRNKIFELPLWIKQVIYIELKEELEGFSALNTLNEIKRDDSFQLYEPKLTFTGKKELEIKQRKLSPDLYAFLEGVEKKLSVIDITVNNGWTLAECSECFVTALTHDLISEPESQIIKGTALYMSGNIRLGEYFVKIGKISIEQLDEALRNQKYVEKSVGEKTGLAEVMINMNFITKADTQEIILLKEEAQKRYIPDIEAMGDEFKHNEISRLSEQVSKLTRENNHLKDQIKKILKI